MSANLVIVESPAKAKTIKKYLGRDFEVLASYGHVRDLIEKEGAVNPDRDFEMKYQLIEKNRPKVDAIERAMKKAGALYLATDPDREGEAISWHLSEILREHGVLDGKDLKRVRFYEITKNAVREAVAQAESGVNENLVNAYKARRALDYLVGFNLSPLLWKKIKPGLSAGRVQSVALRLICEREAEIQKLHAPGILDRRGRRLEGRGALPGAAHRVPRREGRGRHAEGALQHHERGRRARGRAHDPRRRERRAHGRERRAPARSAATRRRRSRRRRCSRKPRASSASPRGARCRPRSGSTSPATSPTCAPTRSPSRPRPSREIRETIKAHFGEQGAFRRRQRVQDEVEERAGSPRGDPADRRVRDAAEGRARPPRRRPAPALRADLEARGRLPDGAGGVRHGRRRPRRRRRRGATGDNRHVLRANGQTLLEPGFLAAYHEDHDEDETDVESEDEQRLPALEPGERVSLEALRPEQHFTQPPPRYTEASLVKSLESHGIGRPSTYASIIETLRYRRYVEMSGRAFIPTDIGKIVSKFLVKYLGTYVEYGFTAQMEDVLDEISNGEKEWHVELGRFWKPFIKEVEHIRSP